MAFVRHKNISGKRYYYLVENRRIGGKVRQKNLKYLGKVPPTAQELSAIEKQLGTTTAREIKPAKQLGTIKEGDIVEIKGEEGIQYRVKESFDDRGEMPRVLVESITDKGIAFTDRVDRKLLQKVESKPAKQLVTIEIDREEWRDTPKDYKSIINGQKYVLRLDKETGATVLAPVKVVDKPAKRLGTTKKAKEVKFKDISEQFDKNFGSVDKMKKDDLSFSLDHTTMLGTDDSFARGDLRLTEDFTDRKTYSGGKVKHNVKEARGLYKRKKSDMDNAVYIKTKEGDYTAIGGDNYFRILDSAKKSGINPKDIEIRILKKEAPVVFSYKDMRILTSPVILDKSYYDNIPKERIINE